MFNVLREMENYKHSYISVFDVVFWLWIILNIYNKYTYLILTIDQPSPVWV